MKPRFYRIALAVLWGAALGPMAAWAQTPAPTTTPAASSLDAELKKADAKFSNGIAAVVNDKIITLKQVEDEMNPPGQTDTPVSDAAAEALHLFPTDEAGYYQEFHKRLLGLEKDYVHLLVDNILIVEEFHQKGYSYPKAVLDQVFDDSITNHFKGDYEAYLNYLRANNLSERDYRTKLEEQIIISGMYQQLEKTTSGISPGRVKQYYDAHQKDFDQDEAVKLRQITLKPVADETPDVLMQQASLIVQEARLPGASFADLARKKSQDDFAKNGGLFGDNDGWLERKKYLPALEDVAFSLKPGEVSDPVVNNGNVYIFECDDKRNGGIQPLESESVHTVIEKILANQDQREAVQKWLQKLESKAYIHYNLGAPDGA